MPRIPPEIWTSRALPLYAVGAAVAIYLLQVFPFTGIFLIFVLAFYWPGLLIHFALVVTAVFAVTGYIRRAWIFIPLLAYGGYYLAYTNDVRLLAEQQATLARTNSNKQVLTFDPARMSLVGKNALRLVEMYAVPVAYEPSKDVKQGYYAWRIVPIAACRNTPRDAQSHIDVVYPWVQTHNNLCMLRMPDTPPLPIVLVTREGPDLYDTPRDSGTFISQKTGVSFGGVEKGSITIAAMNQLTAFPWYIAGCFLNDGMASWDCVHAFQRIRMKTDGIVSTSVFTEQLPEVTLLGLRKYQDSDLSNFTFGPDTDAAIAKAGTEAARVTDDIFAVLADMLKNDDARPISSMDYALSKDPARLGTFAIAIADRLTALQDQKDIADHQPGPPKHPHLYEQFDTLARIMAAVPPEDFAPQAERIFALMQRGENAENYAALYLRAADLGAAAFPQLKDALFTKSADYPRRLVTALALCRAGVTDAETTAELKRRFTTADGKSVYDHEALVVALIRLGETDFVRANRTALKPDAQGWLDAVLAGKGQTDGRPNNCMPEEWPLGGLPEVMRPALVSRGRVGVWTEKG